MHPVSLHFSHSRMDSFLSASAVGNSVEGESVRSHFLNETNMTVRDPVLLA